MTRTSDVTASATRIPSREELARCRLRDSRRRERQLSQIHFHEVAGRNPES